MKIKDFQIMKISNFQYTKNLLCKFFRALNFGKI